MTIMQTMHKQVSVKINACVDEGIAPIVEALSLFDGVETTNSCQGRRYRGEEAIGVVYFLYCPPQARHTAVSRRQLLSARFAARIGRALMQKVDDDCDLTISYSHHLPQLALSVRESAIPGVAAALRQIAEEQSG